MIESKGHKITPIDGDLAVSRNAEIGGDADIHGKARVAGSLKVEGFLDAPHIKGAAKGLFNSVEELTKEYPNPRPGWFAIVLDATDKTKGILYKAENRTWVETTDEAKPYEFIKDSINVFASKGELEDLENKVNVNADDIYHLKHGIDFRPLDDVVDLILYQGPGDSSILLAFLPSADESFAGVMSAEDKRNLNNSTVKVITWNNDTDPSNMNDFVVAGVYDIKGERTRDNDNLPILNTGGGHTFNARLTVLDSSISGSGKDDDKCITQVLSFSNRLGQGEVYIRTGKGSSLDSLTWENWSTLQRNVNVGSVNQQQMDDLTDNGIYSGILSTTGETFVIICINNYAIAQQVGVHHISHLKYSLVVGTGEVKIEKRTRDAYGFWTEWENIGGGSNYELPEATVDTLGGVKLGYAFSNKYTPLVKIATNDGTGVGISIDSRYFHNTKDDGLKLHHNETLTAGGGSPLLSVALGTVGVYQKVIPCVLGSGIRQDSWWNDVAVGIPYNEEQFSLTSKGLNLKDGIGSDVTKVTWDANSNMNDFKTAGVYDIYGERTRQDDNLPILNASSGHSIAARLFVVASTLQPANNEICVTQFLQLSNRVGGDGATYVRTYNENNNGMNGWSAWQKQMGMVETFINNDYNTINSQGMQIGSGLRGMLDNGIYSGIYTDSYTDLTKSTFIETFVLIVINDYAVSGQAGLPRHITQLKYAVDAITGQSTVKKRVGTGDSTISWSEWEEIGGGSSEVDITDAVNQYGLYTLYSQKLMKDNIVYKYQQRSGALPQFDHKDLIRNFLISKGHTTTTAITIIIKKFDSIITLDVDMCVNTGLGGDNGLNHFKFITSILSSVKVSADMEELPTTITFTIDGDVYTVKKGITWGEAIYKCENIGKDFTISSRKQLIHIMNGSAIYLSNNNTEPVYAWDFIREYGVYVTVPPGGSEA